MRFRSVAVLMALVLLCAGFGGAGPGAAAMRTGIEASASVTLTLPATAALSGEAANSTDERHAPGQAEGAQEHPLPNTPTASALPRSSSPWPHRLGMAAIQSPFLEGLQRPPCATFVLT